MQIKHIFFDLDHTLWDFDKNSALAMTVALKDCEIDCSFDEFNEVYHPINEAYWDQYTKGEINKEALKYNRFVDTFEVLKMTVNQETIEQLSKHYLSILPSFNHLHKGAKELLDDLKPNYKLHVITNGFSKVSHNKLLHSGIIDYFEQIVTSECINAKKPNPIVFEYALNKANAQAQESLMVGDNYKVDILGAEAYGIKSVWFDYKKEAIFKHSLTITSLGELKSILNKVP